MRLKTATSRRAAWAVLATLPGAAFAGNLTPPAGPVAPTMKTLDQVEPRVPVSSLPGSSSALHVISQPGSYYLDTDLVGAPMLNGIEVLSGNVDLDLSGFTILGGPGTQNGIAGSAPSRRVRVHNGFIAGWGGVGLQLAGAPASKVERVVVVGNEAGGVILGSNSEMTSSCVVGNSFDGVIAEAGCTLRLTTIRDNLGTGATLGPGASVIACEIFSPDPLGRALDVSGAGTVRGSRLGRSRFDGGSASVRGNSFELAVDPSPGQFGIEFSGDNYDFADNVVRLLAQGTVNTDWVVFFGNNQSVCDNAILCANPNFRARYMLLTSGNVSLIKGNKIRGIPDLGAGMFVSGVSNEIEDNRLSVKPGALVWVGIGSDDPNALLVHNTVNSAVGANFLALQSGGQSLGASRSDRGGGAEYDFNFSPDGGPILSSGSLGGNSNPDRNVAHD